MIKQTLFIATAALCLAVPAQAATWGGTDGDYNDNTAWDTFAVPGVNEDVLVNAGTATVTGANLNRGAVTTVTGGGTLIIDNGRFHNGVDAPSTFNVEAGGTLTVTGNYFLVGFNNSGTFNQTGGTVTANLDRGFFLSDNFTGDSTYNALGGTLNVNLSGTDLNQHVLTIGKGAENDLFLIDGGTVNVTGVSDNRRLYINRNASLQVDSGVLNLTGMRFLVVGRDNIDFSYEANFIVNGGAVSLDVEALVVGGGGAGLFEMNGGTLTSTGNIWVGDGLDFGTVNQTAGDIVIDGQVIVGQQSNGDYNMIGGTLSAADILLGNSIGTFTFSAGTITLAGDDTSILDESWFFNPNGAIAVYDPNSDTTTIGFGLSLVGDTDGDGDVDDFDLIKAITNYTGSLAAGTGGKAVADGDTDNDQDVDDFDLIAMITGYTGSLSAPTSAVPEPASVALLGLGGLLIARRRRSA